MGPSEGRERHAKRPHPPLEPRRHAVGSGVTRDTAGSGGPYRRTAHPIFVYCHGDGCGVRPKSRGPVTARGSFCCPVRLPLDPIMSAMTTERHSVTLRSVMIRVYELARQLGFSSQRVLEEARRAGAPVRSASSLLPNEVVAAVRAAAGSVVSVEPSGHPPAPPARRTHRSPWPNPFAVPRPPRSGDDWWDDEWDRRDPDGLLSAREVARELRVTAAAVRQWASRGYLQASSTQGREKLYRRGDAISAQRTASRKTLQAPAPFPVPPSLLQRPVTTREAARIGGVSESTIRMWVHRGRLTPLPKGSGTGHRFDPLAVLATAREQPARRPKRSI